MTDHRERLMSADRESAVEWVMNYLDGDGTPSWPGIKRYQAERICDEIAARVFRALWECADDDKSEGNHD